MAMRRDQLHSQYNDTLGTCDVPLSSLSSPPIHCGKKRGQTGRSGELNKRLSEFTRASSCALKTAAAACRFSTAWFHVSPLASRPSHSCSLLLKSGGSR